MRQRHQGGISRRRAVQAVGGVVAGTALAAGVRGSAVQAGGASIVGSWRLAVTLQTPAGPEPEDLLATFTADGSYLQASGPGSSSGHGSWRPIDERTAALTFEFFVFQPRFQPPGGPGGPGAPGGSGPPGGPEQLRVTVRAQVTVDATGNRFSGRFASDVHLPTGMVETSDPGTVQGTRIGVEPL